MPLVAVGAAGVPVSVGSAIGAFAARPLVRAVEVAKALKSPCVKSTHKAPEVI